MNVEEALKWVEENCTDEDTLDRLRSRRVARTLADEIDRLRSQGRRAEVLAATIRELRDVVTHDAETKAEFIAHVRAVLSADPDARVTPNAK